MIAFCYLAAGPYNHTSCSLSQVTSYNTTFSSMDDSSNIERVILTATFFPVIVLLIVANIFADRKDLVLLRIS